MSKIKSLVESFINDPVKVKASKELTAYKNFNGTPGTVSKTKIPAGAELIILENPYQNRKESKVLYNNTMLYVDLDQ